MALKTQEREIGGLTYKVTQLGAREGRAVLLRLVQKMGPAVAALMGDNLADAFAKLDALSAEDLTYFCDAFGQKTFVVQGDGKMPRLDQVFDEHFAGRYGDMFKWLAFAAEVNFSDFLSDKAVTKLAEAAGAAASPPPAAT